MPDDATGRIVRAVPLFHRPGPELAKALADYRQVLERAHPLKGRHLAGLPEDVKRLSLALTAERGPGPQANYLSAPANLSAYLYYFLPWNLYRLSRLLTGLELDLPEGASVLDLGCGPLTLAQALWISRPHLRSRRLRFVCVDQTGQALRAGKALFEALTGEAGKAWTIETVQAPAHKAPMEPYDAVMAANALNELARGRGEQGHENLERIADLLAKRLSARGRLFLMEPGTRLGGNLLCRLRAIFLEEGLSPLGPCPHDRPCPMLAPRWRSWCHFVFPAEGAPEWLARLTAAAELDKDRLSLSYLHMSTEPAVHSPSLLRVVSHRFPVPGGHGVYACSAQGLRLLTFPRSPRGVFSGSLLEADLPAPSQRDPKSGVWVTPLAVEEEMAASSAPAPHPLAKRPAGEAEADRKSSSRGAKSGKGGRGFGPGPGPRRGPKRGPTRGKDKA